MSAAINEWLISSRQKLEADELVHEDLDRLEELVRQPCQLVLYLYSKSSNMRSPISSWMFYDARKLEEPTLPSQEPPYESVLAAVAAGWRIVKFPDIKLYAYQGVDNDYLGFEFILEKMI